MRRLPHFHFVRAACIAIGLLCAAQIACGQDRWYRASLIAVGASQVADTASSWGQYELNPVLGTGRFGGRQTAIKSTLVGSVMATQFVDVRRHPRHKRIATIVNFALAGATTGIAIRNWRIR